jgi:hypothetical protein
MLQYTGNSVQSTPSFPSLYLEALRLYRAGTPVIPAIVGKQPGYVDATGQMVPASKTVHRDNYLAGRITEHHIATWFPLTPTAPQGLGVLPGPTWRFWRDGLQYEVRVLDFEDRETFYTFWGQLVFEGHGALLTRLIRERTARGYHLAYARPAQLSDVNEPPQKLAMDAEGKTLIEELRDGHFCVISPTPAGINLEAPDAAYTLEHGDWAQPPTLSHTEYYVLVRATVALDAREGNGRRRRQRSATIGVTAEKSAKPTKPSAAQAAKQGTQTKKPGTLFDRSAATSPNPSEPQYGGAITADATKPEHLPALLRACGLPDSLQVGSGLRCPLPAHDDRHPSARLLGPDDGYRSFGIFCHACRRYVSLVDLLKARIGGDEIPLHTETDYRGHTYHHHTLRLMWTTRLLEEAGVRTFREVGTPVLPPHTPPEARKLWDVFLHVRRIRSATRDINEPFEFSLRFIRDWCGNSYHWAQEKLTAARRWLIKHGYIDFDHKEGVNTFWRMGSRALRRALAPLTLSGEKDAEIIAAVAAVEVPPLPVQEGSACPALQELSDNDRAMLECAQQRLLERRARAGVIINPLNPYGLTQAAPA